MLGGNGGGDASRAIPEDRRFDVVWDLDECLISSEMLGGLKNAKQSQVVETRGGGLTGSVIIHVDDDLLKFRTRLRNWARFVLTLLSPFCRQVSFP